MPTGQEAASQIGLQQGRDVLTRSDRMDSSDLVFLEGHGHGKAFRKQGSLGCWGTSLGSLWAVSIFLVSYGPDGPAESWR